MLRTLPLLACAGAVALVSACGSGGSGSSAAPAVTPTPSRSAVPGQTAGGRFPGVSGLVAAVSGSTAQVQSTDSQTAVTWTGTTTFTATTAADRSALEVGSCVTVRSSGTSSSGSGPVAATAVTISTPEGGSCTAGFGGGAFPGGRPSGAPSTRPSGAPRGGVPGSGGFGGGAFGTVSAVTDSGFTVTSTFPGASGSSAAPRTTQVTTSAATTYAATAPATAAAVVVGVCLTANGTTDDTGALTATRISVRPSENGTCATRGGFGGRAPSGAPGV